MPADPSLFTRFAQAASRITGRPVAFMLASAIIVIWALTGPMFSFNDTWQLVINTGTTIITFLMVFLIQNTQNRDTAAIQIKLDELIRSTKGAHNALLDLENLEVQDVERLRDDYVELASSAREDLADGKSDTQIRETKNATIEKQNKKQRRRKA
ncbi:MAG: low affinity iron permease family protein [Pirellulales bacterium]|nr:low affinity iron permease family protein [Pirellulales bacterium]